MNPTHHVISLGGGVQSTVMLLMASEGLITPMPTVAIFADTEWEPTSIYQHLEWLKTVSAVPIVHVKSGRNLRDDTAVWEQQDGLPALSIPVHVRNVDGTIGMIRHRQCTGHYKIRPIEKYLRRRE